MLSKFDNKSAQKSSIFPTKASYARGLIHFLLFLHPLACFAGQPEVLEYTKAYLLPETHPVKAVLGQIFSKRRAVATEQTMAEAGFIFAQSIPRKITVAKHPALEGYLIKTYLDNNSEPRKEWIYLVRRIQKALKIDETINHYGYQEIMKVPQKWIYVLPEQPDLEDFNQRKCLLIVEDMHILSKAKNSLHYSSEMTKNRLKAIYTVISENLLLDCVYIRNIPFCEDGKIAFIDTEPFTGPKEKICYDCLTKYLSPRLQSFWRKLFTLEEY
jgi:hypothetical protein